jgi:hypothetical protein
MSAQRDEEPTPLDSARDRLERSQRGFRRAQGIHAMGLWRLRQSEAWRRYGPGVGDVLIAVGWLGIAFSGGMVAAPLGVFLLSVGLIAYVVFALWVNAREERPR